MQLVSTYQLPIVKFPGRCSMGLFIKGVITLSWGLQYLAVGNRGPEVCLHLAGHVMLSVEELKDLRGG